MIKPDDKIYVAGHTGLVGSAILRALKNKGYKNLLFQSHKELDLTRQDETEKFIKAQRPDYIFLAAARVGGIYANNTYPAQFIYDNLMVQTNVINAAYENGCKKLLFLGSSCIYPKLAPQPMKEEYLLDGKLEPTNDAYAIAKIAGIKMCQAYNRQYGANFISVMPTNLYGPNDSFDLQNSHVLPALIRKFHEARVHSKSNVEIWGTGTSFREFLHVEDMADACMFLMENYDIPDIINIGTGKDISIKELALLIKDVIGFKGELVFDTSKPDGTPRKLLDIARLTQLGWTPEVGLTEGIKQTYNWYLANRV